MLLVCDLHGSGESGAPDVVRRASANKHCAPSMCPALSEHFNPHNKPVRWGQETVSM